MDAFYSAANDVATRQESIGLSMIDDGVFRHGLVAALAHLKGETR